MIKDPQLMRAVSKINQRSERQDDPTKLIDTYVDVGLLPQLDNRNHQVFYGRRGTGKTHVMKVLESSLNTDLRRTVVYIDCRTLGSSSQFSDPALPMSHRCLTLFKDILLIISDAILKHIVEQPSKDSEKAFEALADFGRVVAEPKQAYVPQSYIEEEAGSREVASGADMGLAVSAQGPAPSVKLSAQVKDLQAAREQRQGIVVQEDKIIFPDLNQSLDAVLKLADAELYLLIDEWSSLPLDIQPWLSEFVKRGLLPMDRVTVKISALEYRCRFSNHGQNGITGFELGADVATAPDLDDYYVFDRNPEHLTHVYGDVLLRHLSSELPENYMREVHKVADARQFASRLFTERSVFAELARASEGVIRDLINIFTKAYFNAHRRGRDSVDKKAVLEAARQWFEQDKAQHLDDQLQDVLSRIVREVIGARRSRSFMLPRELERHPVIQRLFDARVLHHMQRGYADKDNPGVRYNIYSIDYGTYVDLLGTAKQPDVELEERPVEDEVVVPFDDKRSIRRIILDPVILE